MLDIFLALWYIGIFIAFGMIIVFCYKEKDVKWYHFFYCISSWIIIGAFIAMYMKED